jgi:putative pyoverdin transport system ATP-binding/permease protein
MKLLSFLFKYSWGLVAIAILSGITGGLSNVGIIALINATLNRTELAPRILFYSFVSMALLLMITRVISSVVLTRLAQDAVLDLRMQLSRKMLAVPLRDLEEIGPHRLMASLTGDIATITGGLLIIPNLCLQGALLVGSLCYLAWLSGPVFIGTLTFIVLGMSSYQWAVRKALKYMRQAREQQDTLFRHFRAMTEGTKELKLHQKRRRAFISELLEPISRSLRRNNIIGSAVFIVASSWGQLLFFVLIGLLLFGLPLVRTVEPQVLIGYTFTVLYVVVPLEVISSMLPNLSATTVALKKVESLGLTLSARRNEEVATGIVEHGSEWSSLEVVDVTHSYHRERENSSFTLGPINLEIQPGSLIFIVGGNGSGKTTFAKLLTGLYVPETGEVRFNGEPVTDENREFFRQHFSVVHSNFHLFENLLGLASPELDATAQEYLVQLQLDHKVKVEAGKLSTTDLSQGQRKRLALLTAYLEDRPIYLFDEWAADQDPLFKEIFYLRLLPQLKASGKTVIVISHDDHYYYLADRIIKLDEGKLDYDRQLGTAANIPAELVAV